MAAASELPSSLASRITVLEDLVRNAQPENCAALHDAETIVSDTLLLVENSLSIEAAAQSAILDCLTFSDELMHVGIYWADPGSVETLRAQALESVGRFAVALRNATPSPEAQTRGLGW